jgi:hypothetical protein
MWWSSFEVFQRYVAVHGHAAPKGSAVFEGVQIGKWVQKQRQAIAGKAGRKITSEQVTLLRALSGWRDAVIEEVWEENFARALDYCDARGAIPSQEYVAPDGTHLGAWCAKQRQFQRSLTPERLDKLESLPGWYWTARLAAPIHPALIVPEPRCGQEPLFNVHLRELARFVAVYGDRRPSHGDMVGGTDIGRWVARQRNKAERGELTPQRVLLLRGLVRLDSTASGGSSRRSA